MNEYISKPVVIEAMQFNPYDWLEDPSRNEILTFLKDAEWRYSERDSDCLYIETLEGTMLVSPGNWIIKGTKGEYYPCRDDVFREKYEAVTICGCGDKNCPPKAHGRE